MDISNEKWRLHWRPGTGYTVTWKASGVEMVVSNTIHGGDVSGCTDMAFNRKCNYAFQTGYWYDSQKRELDIAKELLLQEYKKINEGVE